MFKECTSILSQITWDWYGSSKLFTIGVNKNDLSIAYYKSVKFCFVYFYVVDIFSSSMTFSHIYLYQSQVKPNNLPLNSLNFYFCNTNLYCFHWTIDFEGKMFLIKLWSHIYTCYAKLCINFFFFFWNNITINISIKEKTKLWIFPLSFRQIVINSMENESWMENE